MSRFSIKDIENLTGIKAHTIRMWEKRYDIIPVRRTETNIRYFTNDDLKIALQVALLNRHGYKISAIGKMGTAELTSTLANVKDGGFQNEVVVNELLHFALSLDVLGFEERLNSLIDQHGIIGTLDNYLFVFLETIGNLWLANELIPAQEHLTSNIIRQKIIVAIDHLPLPKSSAPYFVLLLPASEIHELGLLLVHYLLRKKGISTLYLGANTPLSDAYAACKSVSQTYVWMHLTTKNMEGDLAEIMNEMGDNMVELILSGNMANQMNPQQLKLEKLKVLKDLPAARDYINGL